MRPLHPVHARWPDRRAVQSVFNPDLLPRYNVAPSQPLPVIGTKAGGQGRGLALFKWGFVPQWAPDDAGPKPVNAKAETVATSVMFAESFRKLRCLVPADGFYEWKAVAGNRVPVHFRRKDRTPFAFAGISDLWQSPQGKVFTCAFLTATPNELTRGVHDRMPVVLRPADEAAWLDPPVDDAARLLPLLMTYQAGELEAIPANPAMNRPTFGGPPCSEVSGISRPAADHEFLQLWAT